MSYLHPVVRASSVWIVAVALFLFFVPGMSHHYHSASLGAFWKKVLNASDTETVGIHLLVLVCLCWNVSGVGLTYYSVLLTCQNTPEMTQMYGGICYVFAYY